jgi:hypothetical protein
MCSPAVRVEDEGTGGAITVQVPLRAERSRLCGEENTEQTKGLHEYAHTLPVL